MKFWKIFRDLIKETQPDWQDKFLLYKDLKQQLNLIYPIKEDSSENIQSNVYRSVCNHSDERRGSKRSRSRRRDGGGSGGGSSADHHRQVTPQVNDFLKFLEAEINKFNRFFMDKEEKYVITLQLLKDEVAKAKDSEVELMKVGRKMVDFHGEMILLENYSALNYTGLVKILKKHDKRSTGHLIQLPFIQKVLQEPFFRTEVIKKLVKECEIMIICHILSRHGDRHGHLQEDDSIPGDVAVDSVGDEEGSSSEKVLRVPEELAEIECMENMYLKLTISALRTLKKIRNGSSTVSMCSMPPMEDCDDLD